MSRAPLFRTFFDDRLPDHPTAAPIERIVHAYLEDSPIDGRLIEKAIGLFRFTDAPTPWDVINEWRQTVALLLIIRSKDLLQPCRHLLLERVRLLRRHVLWREFQLLTAYQQLTDLLLGNSFQPKEFFQLSSGACPLEAGNHWSWGQIPHPIFHAELGILLILFAKLSGDLKPDLLPMNGSDSNSFPLEARTPGSENKGVILENMTPLFSEPGVRASRGKEFESDPFIGSKSGLNYLKIAERLADWQLNTVDRAFVPFVGLFSHEGTVAENSLILHNFLLFDSVSKAANRTDLAYAADKLHEHFCQLQRQRENKIPYYFLILESWLTDNYPPINSTTLHLPSKINDSNFSLVGNRQEDISSVATLFGGGTGMGCLHYQDVHIVNYGPQHLPLGDCRGFGLDGGTFSLKSSSQIIETTDMFFKVAGISKLASRPKERQSAALFRQGEHSGFWIDAKQQFQERRLCLELTFNGFLRLSSVAFVFFIKASSCLMGGKTLVKPRSFERYRGKAAPLEFHGKNGVILLEALHEGYQEVQVIPLGGGENFWGADFLTAYVCSDEQRHYCWCLTPDCAPNRHL